MKKIEGNLVDIHNRSIYPAEITIEHGKICSIERRDQKYNYFIIPGFIDSHVHIESSMMTPKQFSDYVVTRGTIAVVTDPHEIANVVGVEGIHFMQKSAQEGKIKTFFTVPSCVPATPFDCSGATIDASKVEQLLRSGQFVGLSEMMNVPGVLNNDPEVMRKLSAARDLELPIDGHAPDLHGEELKRYVKAGITTDHECSTLNEALEKIECGMKILIREGSSARNYESLKYLLSESPDDVMFCTDDSHPDDLLTNGHIDRIVRRAVMDGFDLFEVLGAASRNAIEHYHLPVGMLRIGDPADFVLVADLREFKVVSTYIHGEKVYSSTEIKQTERIDLVKAINNFKAEKLTEADICLTVSNCLTSIKVEDGELLTDVVYTEFKDPILNFQSDIKQDLLKIVYYNRYHHSKPQVATINGFGLKWGAFASSIAHDSHNIIAVGCSDREIVMAINRIITEQGGIALVDGDQEKILPLPIGGIMSSKSCWQLAYEWEELHNRVKAMGCVLKAPFMTLAFMSLIVIPKLKIGEKGLFDYTLFSFIDPA